MSELNITIRPYQSALDRQLVRALIVQLQETEKAILPFLPDGEAIADAYLDWSLTACNSGGCAFVASAGGILCGFATVWTGQRDAGPDNGDESFAYINDLVVDTALRGRGIGARLIAACEAFAQSQGERWIRLHVVPGNVSAEHLYARRGYTPLQVELNRWLDADAAQEG